VVMVGVLFLFGKGDEEDGGVKPDMGRKHSSASQ